MSVTAEAPNVPDEQEPGTEPPAPVTPPEETPEPVPDGEPPPPLEPDEPEPEPLTEKQLNAAMERLDREARRHRDRLSEIMGDEAILLQQCPLCEPHLSGWRFGRVPSEDEWREITAAVYGIESVAYVTAEYVQPCDECAQLGQIKTGSKVPGRETVPCRRCNGFGYVTADTATPPVLTVADANTTAQQFGAPAEAPPDRDFLGRTRDDPNFGRLAGYEV